MAIPSEGVSKGLEGIVAAQTRLSDVRDDVGELIYCGYDINELAGKVSYEEVIYLLHYNHLPSRRELDELKATLVADRELPQGVIDLLRGVPKDAPPMDVIRTAVSALGCFDPERDDASQDGQRRKAMKLIARIPIITASFHRIRQGKELLASDPNLGEAANFLYLITGEIPSEEAAATLDMCYVVHADHGMNASTFSARVTIATLSDMYSAITTAIGTLKGPLHGGANEGVIKMLIEIGSLDRVDAYVDECLAQKKKIIGIGHRVYRTLDPRAQVLRRMAQILSAQLGEPKWIQMSDRIAELMLRKKQLNANVDFYSASTYATLGIDIDLYTPIFAVSRVAGWAAHVIEQLDDNRLIRPRAEYIGPVYPSPYIPMNERP